MAYGSLAYGMLSGTFHLGMSFDENDWRSKSGDLGSLNLFRTMFGPEHFARNLAAVEELKRPCRANTARACRSSRCSWTLSNPVVGTALVGFRTPGRSEENLGALGWEISSADMAEVDAIFARQRSRDRAARLAGGRPAAARTSDTGGASCRFNALRR